MPFFLLGGEHNKRHNRSLLKPHMRMSHFFANGRTQDSPRVRVPGNAGSNGAAASGDSKRGPLGGAELNFKHDLLILRLVLEVSILISFWWADVSRGPLTIPGRSSESKEPAWLALPYLLRPWTERKVLELSNRQGHEF